MPKRTLIPLPDRPYLDRGLAAALGQEIAIESVVGRFEEDLMAPITALRHMMGEAGYNNAADTRHEPMVAQSKSDCKWVRCHRNSGSAAGGRRHILSGATR